MQAKIEVYEIGDEMVDIRAIHGHSVKPFVDPAPLDMLVFTESWKTLIFHISSSKNYRSIVDNGL